MAQVPVRISMTIRDNRGIERAVQSYALLNDDSLISGLVSEGHTLQNFIDGCTDGQVTRCEIVLDPGLDGAIKTAPVSVAAGGAPIEQTGRLNFVATGSPRRWSIAIPALSNNTDVLVGDRIVLTHGLPVQNLIGELLAPFYVDIAYCNDHYQTLEASADAFVSFNRQRKQLQRSSFEVS